MRLRGGGLFVCRRLPLGGSAVGVSHLLVATDVLRPGAGRIVTSQCAVCRSSLAAAPRGRVRRIRGICPVCVRAAVRWNIRRTGR